MSDLKTAPAGPAPSVTVIISTRNRHEQILPAIQSVLANPGNDFELVVVDQSDADTGRRAVEATITDPRLRWISTTTRGLSRSRNIGVSNARGPILAFTDDDCRVPTDWVAAVRTIFTPDPLIALVFGRVLRPEEDREGGFAAEFDPAESRVYQHALPNIEEAWGVGANMAMRRDLLGKIGPFDPILGAGAPFFASEDTDVAIRTVAAGLKMLVTRDLFVTHLGVRHDEDASKLMRGYGVGIGAVLVKHVRLGTKGSARMLARWLAVHGRRTLGNAIRGQKPTGIGYMAAGLWGAARSAVHPVDTGRSVFAGAHEFNGNQN